MSDRNARVHVTRESPPCRRCGHPRLMATAHPFGPDRLWYAYCPSCNHVQEHAAIPEWFVRGLPAPPGRADLH